MMRRRPSVRIQEGGDLLPSFSHKVSGRSSHDIRFRLITLNGSPPSPQNAKFKGITHSAAVKTHVLQDMISVAPLTILLSPSCRKLKKEFLHNVSENT
ncbi:hypothetical protein E2C01_089126 [Portunus trituberculatus]|uniref:Uncharacterized protein n=1 Tax=Portunus trituberculatus TaxID=210409 RepID=A0A5B7JLN5_PORTR|nr:hypothetical protein [Portunus trituberculatus]